MECWLVGCSGCGVEHMKPLSAEPPLKVDLWELSILSRTVYKKGN
jgi:hypothetical protein